MPTDTEPDPARGCGAVDGSDDEEALAALAATSDPAERMRMMAALMVNRAFAAQRQGDGRDTDSRIASAIRTAATATRVELAARKAQGAGDAETSLAARLARAKQRLTEDER